MRPSRLIVWTLAITFLAAAAPVAAQAVVNPRIVEFTASADHDAIVGGVTVLTSYRLDFYLPGAPAPFQAGADLGKPAYGANRLITVENPVLFAIPLGEYVAKVVAVGPGGEAASAPSGPFVSLTAPAAGGAPSFRR